jgi:hypothetical protein
MRPRLALPATVFVATLVAMSAAALPAQASSVVISPDCATSLQNAAAGTAASCSTQGPPPVECNGCGVRRTVDVVVVTGRVDATLVCDGLSSTTHVDGPGTGSIGTWGGQNCTLTIAATADGTTATATSTASYEFVGPQVSSSSATG